MEIKRASSNDIDAITKLLSDAGASPTGITADQLQHVYLAYTKNNELAGVGAMRLIGNVALLHTLAVTPSLRGQGFGYLLIKTLDHAARSNNIDSIYLLSDDLIDYFKRYGYEAVALESVPDSIAQLDLFTQLKATNSHAMRLPIPETA